MLTELGRRSAGRKEIHWTRCHAITPGEHLAMLIDSPPRAGDAVLRPGVWRESVDERNDRTQRVYWRLSTAASEVLCQLAASMLLNFTSTFTSATWPSLCRTARRKPAGCGHCAVIAMRRLNWRRLSGCLGLQKRVLSALAPPFISKSISPAAERRRAAKASCRTMQKRRLMAN